MLKISAVGNDILDKKSFGFFSTRSECENHIVTETFNKMNEGDMVFRKDRQNNLVLSKKERVEQVYLQDQKRLIDLNMEVTTEQWFCLKKNIFNNEQNPVKK